MPPDRPLTFPSLPHHWTPVTGVKALDKKGLLATPLDGVPLVFFRDRNGKACALVDQCPHRSVKLSGGKLTEDGQLQCPFHGWRYDGQGICTHIALNPDVRPSPVQAASVPCEEVGGLLGSVANF